MGTPLSHHDVAFLPLNDRSTTSRGGLIINQFRFRRPAEVELLAALTRASSDRLPYPEVGSSRTEQCPPGYRRTKGFGGLGSQDFDRAKELLRTWHGFPEWVLLKASGPVAPNIDVVVVGHILNLWVTNTCRVTYVIDEPDQYGFGYGALTRHVERGEERFVLRQRPDGQVVYEIYSFSRANHWSTRWGYPVTRHLQKRFIRDAVKQLRDQLAA